MSTPPPAAPLTLRRALLFAVSLTLLFTTIFILLTAITLGGVAYWYSGKVAHTAGLSRSRLIEYVVQGHAAAPITDEVGRKNILVLGVDSLATRPGSPALTDTMMVVSLNTRNGEIHTLPLPRDLWSAEYQTRLNALYAYGADRYPETPERFPAEVISQLTSQPIHHTLVISLEQLATLIDTLGGITVDVPQGFVDEEFPRPDVDVTRVQDPKLLYQRIEFVTGPQTMNGERALQYIRSRHSSGEQGDDSARQERQQQVIKALLSTLTSVKTWQDPQVIGQLTKHYLEWFGQSLPPQEVIATAKVLWPQRRNVRLQIHELGVYPEQENGLLIHPDPRLYQNQWIYILREPEQFKEEVKKALGGK
jgi:LCP family protein required for cell wall assembly